jgi:hypothetical protein
VLQADREPGADDLQGRHAEVDKSQGNEHMADALGYPIHFLFGQRFRKLIGYNF